MVGCAIEVLNVRGHGLHEKIHENCIWAEFRLGGIPYTQQERHRVMYKDEPDLVVQGKLIVDTKTIERVTDHERGQMLNYLRITGLPAGVTLNFKHARLEWEGVVLTKEPRMNANQRQLVGADFRGAPQCL